MGFHIALHACRSDQIRGERRLVEGRKLQVLEAQPVRDFTTFSRSVDQICDHLKTLPRMFLEPDGSFVWVQDSRGARQQLDGLLADDGLQLIHIELKGSCDVPTWEQLLSAIGWPEQMLTVQLVRQGIFTREADFRRWQW